MACAAGAKKKDGRPFELSDFLIAFDLDTPEPEPQTAAHIETALRMWVAANNARYAQQAKRQAARRGPRKRILSGRRQSSTKA